MSSGRPHHLKAVRAVGNALVVRAIGPAGGGDRGLDIARRHRIDVDGGLYISQRPNAVLDAFGDLTNLLLIDNKGR
jgi:hypothetical protein